MPDAPGDSWFMTISSSLEPCEHARRPRMRRPVMLPPGTPAGARPAVAGQAPDCWILHNCFRKCARTQVRYHSVGLADATGTRSSSMLCMAAAVSLGGTAVVYATSTSRAQYGTPACRMPTTMCAQCRVTPSSVVRRASCGSRSAPHVFNNSSSPTKVPPPATKAFTAAPSRSRGSFPKHAP